MRENNTNNCWDVLLIILVASCFNILFNSESIVLALERITQPEVTDNLLTEYEEITASLGFDRVRTHIREKFRTIVDLNESNLDNMGFGDKHADIIANSEAIFANARYTKLLSLQMRTPKKYLTSADQPFLQHIATKGEEKGISLSDAKKIKIGNKKDKILIIGDSIMGGIAPMMRKELQQQGLNGFQPIINWKVSSGLSRTDYYNWPRVVDYLVRVNKINYAILLFGTNDPEKSIVVGKKRYRYGSEKWHHFYKKRILGIINNICLKADKLYWLALPPMRSEKLQLQAQFLNSVYRRTIENNKSCAEFIETSPVIGTKNQEYTSYKKIAGRYLKVRGKDGIHLTRLGGKMVAEHIIKQIKTNLTKAQLAH